MTKDIVSSFIDDWHRERPHLDPSPLAVFGRISRLSTYFVQRSQQWLAPLGLNWETFSVIVTLRRCGPPYQLKPGDLLNVSLLTSGAVTNRIDRVEELGLVVRLKDPHDRRGVIVQLTPDGVARAEEAIEVHLAQMDRLLDPLAKPERDLLASLLSKLLVKLEDDPGPGVANKAIAPSDAAQAAQPDPRQGAGRSSMKRTRR